MWLSPNEIEIFEKVFEREDLIPRNKKGKTETEGYKLKNLSFYSSDTKAITNVCKNLVKLRKGGSLAPNYTNILKKMALIDKDYKITLFGNQLLKILYFEDNKYLKEVGKKNVNISNLSEEIPYIIEFFLYLVVMRCLSDPKVRDDNNIEYKSLAFEPINNLNFFFSNLTDTLDEISNKVDDLTPYFGMDKEELYYFLQGINFNGYEIKRFLKLSDGDKKIIISAFNRAITCTSLPSTKDYNKDEMTLENGTTYRFNESEKKYRRLLHYYKTSTQKDIRNRIKHSILNYILFDSMRIHNNKIKFVKSTKLNKVIAFNELEDIISKHDLHGIANLVYFNRDSKYLSKKFKFYLLDDYTKFNVSELSISEPNDDYEKRNINLDDRVIIGDVGKSNIYEYTCIVDKFTEIDDDVTVKLSKENKVNNDKLDLLKQYIGGNTDA